MLGADNDMIPRRQALGMQMPGALLFLAVISLFVWEFIQPFLLSMEAPQFPVLTGRVVDQAGVLDAQSIARIAGISENLESKTGAQLVTVTVPDLQGRTIEDYGYQLGRHWQIGRKDHDDGVLLIAAPNDRVVRIEVGYGLEGVLTDAASSVIIQNDILPRFRENDLPGGLTAGAKAIATLVAGVPPEERQGTGDPALHPAPQSRIGIDWVGLLFPLAMLLIPLIQIARFLYALINPAYGAELVKRPRRGRGGGGGWGGGSGGGGGGFRGRGGSFGGGGSSGRW